MRYHLARGAQGRWHGLHFVSVGGGYSLDKELRVPGYDWFERETLSKGELQAILEERGEIDVLVSHDCPAQVALELGHAPDRRLALAQASSANVRVFDLAELAALVGRIREERPHQQRFLHGAEAVAVARTR